MFYVYLLALENGQYYAGYTKNLESRLQRHANGFVRTTSRIHPKELIFYAAFVSEAKALDFEKYLKSSSGFAFRNKRLL